MGQAFDPYHKWLGIPPEEQPPNHYRLLGIRDFEDDPDVVQSAADQRMAHLRTYQTGRYADWSQRLLNEVAAAKICLLNATKKAAYDEQLEQARQSQSPPAPPSPDHPFDVAAGEPRPRASAALLAKRRMPVTAIITCVATLCVVLVGAWVYLSSESPENGHVALPPSSEPPVAVSTTPGPAEPKSRPKASAPHAKTESDRTSNHGDKAATQELPPLKSPLLPEPDLAGNREKPTVKPKLSLNADTEPGTPPVQKPDEPEPAAPQRVSAPAADEQDAAMKLARELYRSDFTKAKTPEEKQAMAKRLLGQATAAAKADAGAFVLFRLARDISTQASDMDTALATIDAMSERFQIDAWEMKLEAMQACSKKGRTPPQHAAVAEQALRLAEEAGAAGSYQQAVGLAKLAITEAGAARNKELLLTAKTSSAELQKKARFAAEADTARAALAANPDDPAANVVVGIYYGCLQDDWPKALPHLAKGDDANLQKAAKQELESPPGDGDGQAALGDAWWNAAQNADPARRAALLRHAASWYTRAQANGLGGLAKVRVEKRLDELSKADRETTAVRAPTRPTVPMGKWFSLLPSPNELTGWDVRGCQFNYANRIIELRSQSMYCPIVAKDATLRAKVRRHGGPRIRMFLRESALGGYIAQLTGNDCQIIKLSRNVQPGQQPSMMHGPGSENTLSRVPIPRTPNDVVFEMSFAAVGNTLTIFINRQPVAQAKDAALTEGMVGIGTDHADGLFFTDVELLIPKGSLIVDHR